jgi:hypothetical protein
MNNDALNEMIKDLEYSIEFHAKQLEAKKMQLKALKQMKEGEK